MLKTAVQPMVAVNVLPPVDVTWHVARGTRPCRGAVVSQAVSADGWTPLQLAARSGAADKVALLLAAGADPTAVNQQVCGDTARATR